MLIDCPACARSYHISRTAMGSHGRQVICPRCQESWFVAAELRADDDPLRRAEREELRPEAVSGRDFPRPAGAVPAAKLRRAVLPVAKTDAARSWRPILAGAALICAAMLLIGGRARIVRLWPQANAAYAAAGLAVNLRGLDVKNLRTDLAEGEAAQPILTVSGEIANLRDGQTKVPAIRLSLRDKTGREIYAWSQPAPKPKLGAHETIAFRARLAAPPEASREVLVRFAEAEPAR